jgi:hypothetical protein
MCEIFALFASLVSYVLQHYQPFLVSPQFRSSFGLRSFNLDDPPPERPTRVQLNRRAPGVPIRSKSDRGADVPRVSPRSCSSSLSSCLVFRHSELRGDHQLCDAHVESSAKMGGYKMMLVSAMMLRRHPGFDLPFVLTSKYASSLPPATWPE